MSTRVRQVRRRRRRVPDRVQVALTIAAFGVILGVFTAAYLGVTR